jgi:hypothetical protein
MIYDIIGDIHGHADKLEDLLIKLKYEMKAGVYKSTERKAVFVGDFIDRGTQNRRVIEIVRGMVDSEHEHAYAVMGNHEYNAICYHTKKSDTDYLRPHEKSKFKQHENFLKEYPLGHDDTKDVIDWFKKLPVFKEFDDFHVIHACWSEKAIENAQTYLNDDNTLNKDFLEESATENTPLFNIIETLLKGVEIELPPPHSFKDKDGKKRHHIRVKWWGEEGANYQDLAFGYGDKSKDFPSEPVESSEIPFYDPDNKPVFFGHYWMVGTPSLQTENVCCVDYSAGKGEKLVCYSIDNPKDSSELDNDNFSWSGDLR